VLDRPSGPQDRMQPTKSEIPFGHAFDKRGVSRDCATRRDARFSPGASDRKPRKKFSDRAPRRSGISSRLAQNGVCDRDDHVRKSRSQCTDPDAGHSRDDRSRDEGAHRDADTPKAIGITLIETVRDQHRSQP